MAAIYLYEEIKEILNLSEKDLKELSEEQLDENLKELAIYYKKFENEVGLQYKMNAKRFCMDKMILIEKKIEEIKKFINPKEFIKEEKIVKPNTSEKAYTLNQKFELFKELGFFDLMIGKYDSELQQDIFSSLFDCHIDTARKILDSKYKKTNPVRPLEFNQLITKITKTKS